MTTTPADADSPIASLSGLLDRFGAEVAVATPDASTPCSGWSVRDVVEHVVGTQRDFMTQRGLPVPGAPDMADLASGWAQHSSDTLRLLGAPGVADTEFDSHFGATTIGRTFADFYGFDLAVHAWDLARSGDRPAPFGEQEAEGLRAVAEGWGPALRMDGVCGEPVPVPDTATAVDSLLGFLGRDPHWRP